MKNKITRKIFLEWLDKYSTIVYYHTSDDGTTTFLDILGSDGGDVTKTGLSDDRSVVFSKPETVDKWYKEIVDCFKESTKTNFSLPMISFVEFCKIKKLI